MKVPAFFALLLTLSTSQAALNDLGNGLVADTGQNIYWLKDANIVWTACHATSGPEKALWDAFDPENNPGNMGLGEMDEPRNKQWICDYQGAMKWPEAEVWIQLMNQQSYLGITNWRMPNTPQPDTSCETQQSAAPHSNQGSGYNCRGSEMGHLFNIGLGNPNHAGSGATGGVVGTSCGYDSATNYCFDNQAPFQNAGFSYFSNTPYAPNTLYKWLFNFAEGRQSYEAGIWALTWPVRDPEPSAVPALPLPSLLGLIGMLAALGLSRLGAFRTRAKG